VGAAEIREAGPAPGSATTALKENQALEAQKRLAEARAAREAKAAEAAKAAAAKQLRPNPCGAAPARTARHAGGRGRAAQEHAQEEAREGPA
jgi:hypothetical protein